MQCLTGGARGQGGRAAWRTCRVTTLSPAWDRVTWRCAAHGPLPSDWTAWSVPDSPAWGACRTASKLSSTLPLDRWAWRTLAAAGGTHA